jgi:hypothetical protein
MNGGLVAPLSPRQRLSKLETTMSAEINNYYALVALLMSKGIITWEELNRMTGVVRDARPKLSKGSLSIPEALRVIIASSNLTKPPEHKGETGG